VMFSRLFLLSFCVTLAVSALIPTPFGLRPEQCHHKVPSGSRLENTGEGVFVQPPNAEGYLLPALKECVDFNMEYLHSRSLQKRPNALWQDGWLDNAGYYPPTQVEKFTGDYLVPPDPKNDASQVLFYFIGTENFQSGIQVSILQPVLTWGNGINGWNMASWNCCPQGQSHESDSISGIKAGATVSGIIDQSQGENWTISSTYQSQTVNLIIAAAQRDFDWIDATLETYSVTACNMFPDGPLVYSNMVLTLGTGPNAPSWQPSAATECNGTLTVNSPSKITISHNQ